MNLFMQSSLKAYLPLLAFSLLVVGLGSFIVLNSPQFKYLDDGVIHGPHASSDLIVVVSSVRDDIGMETASRYASVFKKQRSVAAQVGAPTPALAATTTAPAPTLVVSIAAPSSGASGTGYGIAAGGGLIWLGQSDLDTYFGALQALGVTWVRWDMDWSVVQPNNVSTYNWHGPDLVAATAAKYGINSLAIINRAPSWAIDPSMHCTPSQNCPPQDPAAFARFAGAAAARYKGVITAWEIWNEPNLNSGWTTAAGGAGYSAYLKAAYTVIKQVNPSALVLTGGLAAAGDGGSNTSPATFIRTLYASGAQNYFDAIALHPYSYPIEASYVASWNSWQQMSAIRQLMIDNGDSAKKIWVTEYGAPTGGPGSVKDLNQLTFTYGSDYMSEGAQ